MRGVPRRVLTVASKEAAERMMTFLRDNRVYVVTEALRDDLKAHGFELPEGVAVIP